MAELADAHGSGPCEATHAGSTPVICTIFMQLLKQNKNHPKKVYFQEGGFILL